MDSHNAVRNDSSFVDSLASHWNREPGRLTLGGYIIAKAFIFVNNFFIFFEKKFSKNPLVIRD